MNRKLFDVIRSCSLALVVFLGHVIYSNAQCPTGATLIKTHTDVTCNGANNATITVELANGGSPLNFELFDLNLGSIVTLSVVETNDPDANGNFRKVRYSSVYPSNFSVLVFKSGCTVGFPLQITETPFGFVVNEPVAVLTATLTSVSGDCNPTIGVGTGSIDVTTTGGTAPYTFLWTDAITTEDRSSLDAGSYHLDVTDSKLCTTSLDVTVPDPPTTSLAGSDQTQCNNGTFTLAGNTPVIGVGVWSIVGSANGASITTPSSPSSGVTGLTAGNSVTLRWSITNSTCTSADDVILTSEALPTTPLAGSDQSLCNNGTFTLAGNTPVIGTGTWSIVGAANGASITTPSSPISGVTGLTVGNSVTLRWTITNGTCTSFDDVVLSNDATATVSDAGLDQAKCNNGTFTLAGNTPAIGTGTWSIVGAANGASITTPSSPTSDVTGLIAGNSVTLRWTITSGSCPSSVDDVVLTNDAPVTVSNAGLDQLQCNNGTFALGGNSPVTGTGAWSIVGAANGATITTPSSPTSGVTGLTVGNSVTLRWTITNGTCTSFDDVVLSNNASATVSDAGLDQAKCNNGTFTLAGNTPVTGTGAWSIVGAANGASITTPSSPISGITGLIAGNSVTLRWTITSGSCPSSVDDVVLTNDAPVTVSNAGLDQPQCNNGTFTLGGNTPVTGTGAWSVVGAANGASITTPSLPTSGVTGLTVGNSVTLRWTITNGTCTSFDDVILTNDITATVSDAGLDQAKCNNGTFTLGGNTPVTGTGAWSIVGSANGASITTPSSPISGVTGLIAGNSVTLRWTITNGACTSFDDVVLTNDATATVSDAGLDQAKCNNGTFTLAGNTPVTGTGAWSIVGAANGASITTPSLPTSGVTGLTVGNSVTLRWTITNGTCTSFDDVILTNDITATVSDAGLDQAKCNNGTFTLGGNTPVTGTGAWSIVGSANGASITTPSSPISGVTGLIAGNSVTLRWTITNGACTSFDDVVLTNDAPVTVSNAGLDQPKCNNGTFTLAGNSPVTGTGAWSIVGAANGASITTPSLPTSGVTGLTVGNSVTLRWTITNGTCTSFDDVILTNDAAVTVSDAGLDQAKCNNGTFTLAGNSPVTGTGAWIIVGSANGASITTPSSPISGVTGLIAGNSVTLRWTITNGSCTSFDDVVLTNDATATVSDAGLDQAKCNNGTFTLAGNTPVTGTGAWSIVGAANGASITTPSLPTSGVTGLTVGNSVALRWTITNGTCTSFDDVVLTNDAAVTVSDAGLDQAKCNDGTFTLSGNSPVTGTGAWSIVGAANGASITTPSSPISGVTGLIAGNSVTLRWTITNGSCASFDDVVLTNDATATVSDAGLDQAKCNNGTFTLAGNTPVTGTGAWSIVGAANGASITTPSLPTSGVTGLTVGNSVALRWTITNGTCTSFDDVVLTNDAAVTVSDAGLDQAKCNNGTFTLAGNSPVTGTGAWTIVGSANGASITTPSSPISGVTGLIAGNSVTLRWTITNGSCTSFDDVVLTNDATATVSDAGLDQAKCNNGTFTLAGNTPVTGTGAWSIVGAANGASITTPSLPTSGVTGLTVGNSVTLRWTITNGTCTSFDDVVLTNDAAVTVSDAGLDQAKCNNGTFTLSGNSPVTGTGAWIIVGSANGASITTPSSPISGVTGLIAGNSVTLRWTITNGSCTSFDDVVLTNDATATVSDADLDQTQCNNGTFTLSGNTPVTGTGAWSIVGAANGASITTPSLPTSGVTGLTVGNSVTLRWTITNGSCTSLDDVVLTNDAAVTVSNAGSDQNNACGTVSLNANAPISGTGLWNFAPGGNPDGLGNFVDVTNPLSGFNGTPGQTYILRWTISNGSCTSFDDVQIQFDISGPTASNAGLDQLQCNNGVFTLAGNTPVIGVGAWSIVGAANGASITTPSSPVSGVTGLTVSNSVTLRWTITSGGCSSADDVVLTNDALATVSNAGADQPQCNNGTFTLAGNTPVTGTGAWSIVGSANGASITTPSSPTSGVTGLTVGNSVTLRWTITNGSCTSFDDVVLTNDAAVTVSSAGSDQNNVCGTAILNANMPISGTGLWSFAPGGDPDGLGNFVNGTNPSSAFNGTAGQIYVLRWTISNGSCTSFDDVQIQFSISGPTASNAGSDQSQCSNGAFTLAGNTPVVGVGSWSIVGSANGASITTASSPTSAVSGLTVGNSVTLRWTISNGGCSSSDDVVLTNDVPATISLAGSDQAKCNDGTFTLAGNSPITGIGSWSVVGSANGATVTTPSSPVSGVTGLIVGNSVTLRWTITNGSCTNFDDVVLANDAAVTVSVAGSDQNNVCGTVTLNANTPVSGVGLWSFAPGGNPDGLGNFVDTTNPLSGFNGTPGQTYILRWTISNGSCSSFDDVQIQFDISGPTASNAGLDQSQCSNGVFTLAGNTPVIGIGSWSIVGSANGASITTPSSPTSAVSGLTVGNSVTLRWTITSGGCSSADDVVLTNDAPATISVAGSDQPQCNNGNFTLAGNAPTTGVGTWSIVGAANGASITTPSSPTSAVAGLTVGNSVTLRWSISSGSCPISADDVVLTNDAAVTVSAAGSDQNNVCGTATMGANVPVSGLGLWSFAPGGNPDALGVFVDTTNPASGFNGTPGQTYILRWTISNGACLSFDDVQVQFDISGPTASNAGSDQSQCTNGNFTLAGNAPIVGVGTWSVVGAANGASITTPSSPTSAVTGLTVGNNVTLRWTITSGGCTSIDDVILTNSNSVTVAAAGADQALCNNGNFTLAGNTPVTGVGTWSIIGATNGASITTPSSPTSGVSGLTAGNNVTLRWTITNGGCTSVDDVVLSNNALATVAAAGTDQSKCNNGNFTLAGNAPVTGVGVWSIIGVANGASITTPSSPTSTVTGLNVGNSVTLRWTITNGACVSTDDVVLNNGTGTTPSAAGPDQVICGSVLATLAGNTPASGQTGIWSVNPGTGVVLNPNSPTSQFVGNMGTSYTLRWIIANGSCAPSLDDVVINFAASPASTTPVTACVNTTAPTLTATATGATSIQWYTDAALTNLVFTGGSYVPAASELNMTTAGSTTFYVVAQYGCGASAATQVVVNVSNSGACGGGTGQCATVSITPIESTPANCAASDGKVTFSIKPWVPANNIHGVIISISGPTSRTQKNDSIFNNLKAGSYTYKVIYGDSLTNGCITTGVFILNKTGTAGYPVASNIVPPSCFGDSTGSATITVSKPVDITGQILQWSVTPSIASSWKNFTAGGSIVGIPAGIAPSFIQTISIRKDASDPCYAGVTLVIPNGNPRIKSTFNVTPATCTNNDGAIKSIAASGGSGSSYQFAIDGATFQSTNEFLNIPGGVYTLSIRDQIGCVKDTTVNVTFPGFVNFVVTPTDADCTNNGRSGKLNVLFSSPGDYKVGISKDSFTEPTVYRDDPLNSVSFVFDSLSRGTYYVFAKSSGSACPTRQGAFDINGTYAVSFDILPICAGNKLSISLSNMTGELGIPLEINIYKKNTNIKVQTIGLASIPATQSQLIPYATNVFLQTPDAYQIQIEQDQSSCLPSPVLSELIDFVVPDTLTVQVDAILKSLPEEPTGTFKLINFAGGLAPYKSKVRTVSDFENVTKNNDLKYEKIYKDIFAGTYKVDVMDSLGCSIALDVDIPLDTDIYIPNIFTPNGDGYNDVFFIRNLPASNASLTITNRWGKEVYRAKVYSNETAWTGEGTADGTYFYSLQIGSAKPVTGWIEIMRGTKP